MLTKNQEKDILKKAQVVNSVSDEYQLIHATFALQKLSNEQLRSSYEEELSKLRERIQKETDAKKLEQFFASVKELREAKRQKKISISILYLKELDENSARTTRTGNTYMILLPESLKKIRNGDGSFILEKLKSLRHLMAHELGHIFLHSDLMVENSLEGTELFCGEQEEEADYFADQLIRLRRERNDELYADEKYTRI